MKVSVTYDFGEKDLVSVSDIKISASVEATVGTSYFIPEIREVIAGGLAPILSHLNMPEKGIQAEIEALIMSGHLSHNLKWPYYYDDKNHVIRSREDSEEHYSIRDYLEGKVPDLSV